jgi:chromate transporter
MQLQREPAAPSMLASKEKTAVAPSLRAIFLVFLKMGTFAFGGVYSMLSFFQRELVDRRRWLTEEELTEGVAIGQMTPGPPIINTGIFIGYRLRGVRGAVTTTSGQVLPGFLLVLILAFLYTRYKSVPLLEGALKGIGAAVVGLLGSVVLKMGRQVVDGWQPALLALGGFVLLYFVRANPILLIAGSGMLGYLLYRRSR